ncbi:MAG TPA: glycogen/starch synthase, partial [Pirellulaceae bacterium]
YRCVWDAGIPLETLPRCVEVPVGNRLVSGRLLRSHLPHSDCPVYFVAREEYFDRAGLYGDGKEDYRDNCERFVFFCRAVLEAVRELELEVDLLHCNDWQTGLVPVYLSTEYGVIRGYEKIRTLMTIHNMAYQGRFWYWDMVLTGLDSRYFNWRQLEFYGDLNLLKAGLVFSDTLTTVSPTYAREIQSSPHGCGLEGVLSGRRQHLVGILNGADYRSWNPETDEHLPRTYGISDRSEGKAACKADLQRELGLPLLSDVPLIGFVGRLVEQKGVELILGALRTWARTRPAQWVILGTGQRDWELQLEGLAAEYPQRVAAKLSFSESLAHRITAAADIFVMPSRFEPCGLNQLYSLKYGTVPVVHRTGGLADTVRDADPLSIASGEANGFSFEGFDGAAFEQALARACDLYQQDPAAWGQLATRGMTQDWSWRRSAAQYADVYRETLEREARTVGA